MSRLYTKTRYLNRIRDGENGRLLKGERETFVQFVIGRGHFDGERGWFCDYFQVLNEQRVLAFALKNNLRLGVVQGLLAFVAR